MKKILLCSGPTCGGELRVEGRWVGGWVIKDPYFCPLPWGQTERCDMMRLWMVRCFRSIDYYYIYIEIYIEWSDIYIYIGWLDDGDSLGISCI